jgi:hypothetical protein
MSGCVLLNVTWCGFVFVVLWLVREGEQYAETNRMCTFMVQDNIKINVD